MTYNFYDSNDIIEINEKRLQQQDEAYQKVLDRLTHILLIYSGLAIYLIPIAKEIFVERNGNWYFILSSLVYSIMLGRSLYSTTRLILPKDLAYQHLPMVYYTDTRLKYEALYPITTAGNQKLNEDYLRASYINEQEEALGVNSAVIEKKKKHSYNALIYSLIGAFFYLICIGFMVIKKENTVSKVQLVNPEISLILHKMDSMSKTHQNSISQPATKVKDIATTKLAGIDSNKVIVVHPRYIKENASKETVKKKN